MEVNGVEFEEDTEFSPRVEELKKKGKTMGDWLIEKKIAKNPIQANTVLLIVIVVCIIGIFSGLYVNAKKPVGPTYSQQLQAAQMNKTVQRP